MPGAVSQQNLLTQRLTLLQAEQSLRDTQALLAESNVLLVKNLGGGWQRDDAEVASVPAAASSPASDAARPAVGAARRLTSPAVPYDVRHAAAARVCRPQARTEFS